MGTLTPTTDSLNAAALRRTAFEDRYGAGSFDRLLELLEQPCVPFAHIAGHFGVTRERVRQWQREWFPDAPTGLQRRRLCAAYQEKKRLMLDSLFRSFHRHARAWFGTERIHPVRSRRGYRAREVRIDDFVIAIRDASTATPRYRGRADFIYFRLPGDEFLFVPSVARNASLPRNTFAPFESPVTQSHEPFAPKEQSL
jgi:hypothetical protein